MPQDKGPAIDPEKAKQIQDSAMQSGYQPGQWWANIKAGLGIQDQPAPAPTAVAVQPPAVPVGASAASGAIDPEKAALAQESMRRAMPQDASGDPGAFAKLYDFLIGQSEDPRSKASNDKSQKKPGGAK